MSEPILGIDLGTTHACAAVLEGDEPVVVHNREGARTTPSVVSWRDSGQILVGAPALRQRVTRPERTVFEVKRLMGRRLADEATRELASALPYALAGSPGGDVRVSIGDERLSPPEISAHVLREMRDIAQDYLGRAIREAVITVPAYFDDAQRQATKDAGAIAGLKVRALLNEPTAAALAGGARDARDRRVAVVDLGGGTFDISVVTIDEGEFQVLATAGDAQLGGADFDRRVVELLARHVEEAAGADVRADPTALQRLLEAAERAKIELSSALSTEVHLPFLAASPAGPVHLAREVSRGELERACRDLLERLERPCAQALEAARAPADTIDEVLIVGGMTRMPAVREKVGAIFGKPPRQVARPDEIVAAGAAIQGGIAGGEIQEVALLDVTPHALGVRAAGDRLSIVIPQNTRIPARGEKRFAPAQRGQPYVAIEVYQGDAERASDNRFLGRFILGDLPSRARQKVRVRVAFEIDADGLLEVSAREEATGRAASVTIEGASGLAPGDIDAMRHAGERARSA